MAGSLTERERDVIAAMRASPRAEQAIYNYATKFAGDDQAVTPASMSEDYRQSYVDDG